MSKYNKEADDALDKKRIIEVQLIKHINHTFSSERITPESVNFDTSRKKEFTKIQSTTNYDDHFGNPLHAWSKGVIKPTVCNWKFITPEDTKYLKEHQWSKNEILSFLENKFPYNTAYTGKTKSIFLQIMWECFIFTRDKLFYERSISAILDLIFLTHCYFLLNPWHTAVDIYIFFYNSIILNTVEDPPESCEIFTPAECELLFQLFQKIYMENLALLRLTCLSNIYNLMDTY